MNILNLSIPNSLYEQVKALAIKEGVPLDEFIAMALVEKVATLEMAG